MATLQPFFFILFIHLGCFPIFSTNPNPNPKPHKSPTRSILSYLLSFSKPKPKPNDANHVTHPSSPLSSPPPNTKKHDIYPCITCGEVLTKPQLLDLHQATKHSLSEFKDDDSGKSIVQIIFQSGWKGKNPPTIHRILKIHNSSKTLSRFEEYRETVRSRGGGDPRCVADGNERLRFYCTTVVCDMMGRVTVCGSPYCNTCGIVRHGFVGKQWELDGIGTHVSGWGAHVSLAEEVEREFAFLHVRRAVVVCRVVAGRVARGGGEEGKGFDSHVEGEELLVFNPRAVLPCFVVIYSA